MKRDRSAALVTLSILITSVGLLIFYLKSFAKNLDSAEPTPIIAARSAIASQAHYPGDTVTLRRGDNKVVPSGVTAYTLQRLLQLWHVGDDLGIREMAKSKRALLIDSGTTALVISIEDEVCEIRILEGEYRGEAVYIPTEYIR